MLKKRLLIVQWRYTTTWTSTNPLHLSEKREVKMNKLEFTDVCNYKVKKGFIGWVLYDIGGKVKIENKSIFNKY